MKVPQCTAIFKLFASEDQSLLIGWDPFLILDLLFHIVDRIARLDI